MFHLASQILPKDTFCKVHPEKRMFKKNFLKLILKSLSLIFEVKFKLKQTLNFKLNLKSLNLLFLTFFSKKLRFTMLLKEKLTINELEKVYQ